MRRPHPAPKLALTRHRSSSMRDLLAQLAGLLVTPSFCPKLRPESEAGTAARQSSSPGTPVPQRSNCVNLCRFHRFLLLASSFWASSFLLLVRNSSVPAELEAGLTAKSCISTSPRPPVFTAPDHVERRPQGQPRFEAKPHCFLRPWPASRLVSSTQNLARPHHRLPSGPARLLTEPIRTSATGFLVLTIGETGTARSCTLP